MQRSWAEALDAAQDIGEHHADASAAEPAGAGSLSKPKSNMVMPRPPSLTTTSAGGRGRRSTGARSRENLLAPAGVGSDGQRRSHMIEDERCAGEGVRKVGKLTDLRVIEPAVEREAEWREARETVAERRIKQQSPRYRDRRRVDGRIGIKGGALTDALEPHPGTLQVRLEERLDGPPLPEINKAYDSGANARRPVQSARAHRRDAVDEFRFSDSGKARIGIDVVHGVGVDMHRAEHVVTGADIREDFVEKIASAMIPQMMMRVDDRQISDRGRPPG